jgi:hypothetical protein
LTRVFGGKYAVLEQNQFAAPTLEIDRGKKRRNTGILHFVQDDDFKKDDDFRRQVTDIRIE